MRAHALDDGDVEQLFVRGQLGLQSSQSLLNMLWLFFSICFGMRGGTEHRDLRWGDVVLKINSDGREYLEYNERQTKTRTGEYNNS